MIPLVIAPIATKATSRFSKAINTKAMMAMTMVGQSTSAGGIRSRETTAITPTTAALTPARTPRVRFLNSGLVAG